MQELVLWEVPPQYPALPTLSKRLSLELLGDPYDAAQIYGWEILVLTVTRARSSAAT
jgi:hypothetical protein